MRESQQVPSKGEREAEYFFMASEALAFAYLMEPLEASSTEEIEALTRRAEVAGESPPLVEFLRRVALAHRSRRTAEG